MDEEWREIAGFEGFFAVSNMGRVKSLGRRIDYRNQFGPVTIFVQERILTPSRNGRYPTVCLSVHGKITTRQIHRLVLEAFVGPCPLGMECRHFPDRDPRNNRLDNLQWGSKKENAADKRRHGTVGRCKHTAQHRAKMSVFMTELWKKRRSVLEAL